LGIVIHVISISAIDKNEFWRKNYVGIFAEQGEQFEFLQHC